jgi:hypothetical protein
MSSPAPLPFDELKDSWPEEKSWPNAYSFYGPTTWPRLDSKDIEARLGKPLADLRDENDRKRGGPSNPIPYSEFGMPTSEAPCPRSTFYECFKSN